MPGILQMFAAGNPSGYQVSNSLRFRSSASAYLNRTPASASNQTTWTWSGWVKRGTLVTSTVFRLFGAGTYSTSECGITFSGYNLELYQYSGGGFNFDLITNAVYRDPSAWYHIVIAYDSTQATSTNRIKMYVNGVQITSFGTASYPSLNYSAIINSTSTHYHGFIGGSAPSAEHFDGYMADINFIDGQALTPSSFGAYSATTSVWGPAQYTGSYGTNGFYLKFSNGTSTTTLGYDTSGNSNNWTTNNISLTAGSTYDWMIDSPTSYAGSSYGVGNYCVLNPVNIGSASSLNSGNLNYNAISSAGSIFQSQIASSFSITSGKYYWEVIPTTTSASGVSLGVAKSTRSMTVNPFTSGISGEIYVYIGINGNKHDGVTSSAYGATYTTNDVIGVALDMDAGTITFYKNNTSQGTAFSSISGSYMPFLVCSGSGETNAGNFNFGQRPFSYTPPSGFKSLCTYNLSQPTIQQGNKFMDATLYTGTGSSLSVTNAGGFQPDFVWIKSRNDAYWHFLYDSVRGATKSLESNLTNAEATYTQGLTAFNANGFQVGTQNDVNLSGDTFVGWQWKASNAAAVTNTAGSITSQVSANTTSGFSVVTYTGTLSSAGTATVGHGLGVAPDMVITKARSGTSEWIVHHKSLSTPSYAVFLNGTSAQTDTSGNGTIVAPTSSVFTTNWTTGQNLNGVTQVAYCFASIPGYSAFGSYTGNGSTDGPFIYLGFRPKYVLYKRTDSAANWIVIDTTTNPYNIATNYLQPNLSNAEGSDNVFDIVSNGLKFRSSSTVQNASGGTYVYACFAESPFNYALAR